MTDPVVSAPTRAELEAAHCLEADDVITRRPRMTAWRQRSRLHHARWREARGLPIGRQPMRPRPGQPSRPVGSRLDVDMAMASGATFLTDAARNAARERSALVEPHQTFDRQRLWADLLWSPTLTFNVFGELAADLDLADRAVHAWWPDAPGVVSDVRFVHSPGRFDPAFLNSLRAFGCAISLDQGDGGTGVLAIATLYHERLQGETPKPENLDRYLEVARRSGAFRPGVTGPLTGRTDLCVMWLEHLLLLSMLQHASGRWTWGRYVVVVPSGNPDMVDLCARYGDLLADASTFTAVTLERLLDADALPSATVSALRERYLPA